MTGNEIVIAAAIALASVGAIAACDVTDPGHATKQSPGVSQGVGSADARKDVITGDPKNEGFGTITIPVTVTNHSGKTSDYSLEANLYDADGVQVGTAFADISRVSSHGVARSKMFGDVSERDVVSSYRLTLVERTASY